MASQQCHAVSVSFKKWPVMCPGFSEWAKSLAQHFGSSSQHEITMLLDASYQPEDAPPLILSPLWTTCCQNSRLAIFTCQSASTRSWLHYQLMCNTSRACALIRDVVHWKWLLDSAKTLCLVSFLDICVIELKVCCQYVCVASCYELQWFEACFVWNPRQSVNIFWMESCKSHIIAHPSGHHVVCWNQRGKGRVLWTAELARCSEYFREIGWLSMGCRKYPG